MSAMAPPIVTFVGLCLGIGWWQFGEAIALHNMVAVAIVGPIMGGITLSLIVGVLLFLAMWFEDRGEKRAK